LPQQVNVKCEASIYTYGDSKGVWLNTASTASAASTASTSKIPYFPHPRPPKLLGCVNYCVDHCDLNIVNVDGSGNWEIQE